MTESPSNKTQSKVLNYFHQHGMFFLLAGVSSILLLPNLLTRGLFVDGLVYSSISRNLSKGIGDFWTPYYAEVKGDVFVEHPPLFFWLESFWFQLIGDYHFTERLFSLGCYILTALALFKLCKIIFKSREQALFSVLLVTITPIVYWAFGNNMMEMLLVLPVVMSMHILYRRFNGLNHWWDLPIIGLWFIFFLLIKGPVALGIAVLPFVFIFKGSIKKVFQDGLLLIVLSALFLFILLQFKGPSENLQAYMDAQVMGVLSGDRASEFASSRFKLMRDLAQQLILPFSIPIVLYALSRKKPAFTKNFSPLLLTALLFSLPFLISRKQHAYYLVPALTFFALYSVASFKPAFDSLLNHPNPLAKTIIGGLGLLTCCTAFTLMAMQSGKQSRDRGTQNDLALISEYSTKRRLALEDDLHQNWSLYGYAMRFHDLDLSSKDGLFYCVASKKEVPGYEKINLPTENFHLFKKVTR